MDKKNEIAEKINTTQDQYRAIIILCKELFDNKNKDYGTSWRVLRPSSLTDQLLIKTQRIRTIQQTQINQVGESIEGEFMAIINYCIMALIQLDMPMPDDLSAIHLTKEQIDDLYEHYSHVAYDLMCSKNQDYGEAWRTMRVSSMTDFIFTKLLRIKQIEDNNGQTIASEGIASNYLDVFNYAVFALIHLTKK